MEKFPLDLYKHYRPAVKAFSQVKVPTFPSYFAYNKALWNFIINKNKEEFEAHLLSAPTKLEKLLKTKDSSDKIAELEVFDVASFLVQTLIFYSTNPSIADIINKDGIKSGMKLMAAFRNIMEYTSLISYAHRYDETVLRAILCPLRVRLIERTTVLKGLGINNYTVHISSPIMADMLAAENTNTPAIMCDIEGDFRLASKDLCLKGIRKRLTAGIKIVLDLQTNAHLLSCPLDVYVDPQDLKSYLEDRAQVLGMISCYKYCQDLVEGIIKSKPEVKKAKAPKKKVEQEYVADEVDEVDDYEDMVASYKENGVKVHYKSTWKAPQQKKKSPTKEGSESSVQCLRRKILKELKEALRTYIDIKLDLDYYSRTELLSFGLRKLERYLQQKESRIWVVHLFYYLDSHGTLNEYLRKNKKSIVAEQLHGYSDALYFRKFLCSQDYVHGVLEFLSSSFKNPTNKQIMDLASTLENLIPYILIADSLGQKAKQVSLSASLLPYINTKLTKEPKQVLEANIPPLVDGEIFEVLSWVATLCEGGVDCERVLRLLINLFANIPGLDEDTLNTLTDAVAALLDADPFGPYTKDAKDKTKNSKTKTDPKETKDPVLQNIIDNFNELNVLNQDDFLGLPEFYKAEEFVSLTLKSNEKEAQKNFTKSEKAWVHDMAMIAKRITLQKRLVRLFKRRKGLKLRERATFNHFKTDFASELVETALSLNDTNLYKLQGYIGAIDLKTEIFEVSDKGIHQVMTYYAKSTFASPLDFHYISNIMQKLIVCGEDYTEALKEGLKNPEKRKKVDVSSLEKEKLQEVEGIVRDFEKWCDDKALQDNIGEKEVKTKKLVRAKWEEEAIMVKMQQIAKKRKGLKRQELQQRKNMLLGLFKKS